MTRTLVWQHLACVAIFAACGARSELGVTEPVAGSGGASPSTGGTGNAGAGGSSATGGIAGCAILTPLQPILDVEQPSGVSDRAPSVVSSSDDGEQVSVAFLRESAKSATVAYATLHPWGTWPDDPSLGPVFAPFPEYPDASFLASSSFGGRFAVMVQYLTFQITTVVSQVVDPNAPNTGAAWYGGMPAPGAFLAAGPIGSGWHLVGTLSPSGLYFSVIQGGNPQAPTPFSAWNIGCSGEQTTGDAVPEGGGWLIGVTNSTFAPGVMCSNNAFGPPTRIDISSLQPNEVHVWVASVDTPSPITSLDLVRRGDTIDAVFQSSADSNPIRAVHYDVSDESFSTPFDVTSSEDGVPSAFDATALGDDLAVVWTNEPDTQAAEIQIVLSKMDGTTHRTRFPRPFAGPPRLVAAPNGERVLLTWSEPDTSGSRVKLARFDCASP